MNMDNEKNDSRTRLTSRLTCATIIMMVMSYKASATEVSILEGSDYETTADNITISIEGGYGGKTTTITSKIPFSNEIINLPMLIDPIGHGNTIVNNYGDNSFLTLNTKPGFSDSSRQIVTTNGDLYGISLSMEGTLIIGENGKAQIITTDPILKDNNNIYVTNYGSINNIDYVNNLQNYGTVSRFYGITDVINEPTGILELTGSNSTDALMNNGIMDINDAALTIQSKLGDTFANTGKIHVNGYSVVEIINKHNTNIVNTGEMTRTGIGELGDSIINLSMLKEKTAHFVNTGRITADTSALTIYSRTSDGGGSVEIINNGEITGDIITITPFDFEGIPPTVTLDNGKSGMWAGTFLDIHNDQIDISNKFVQISNSGTIKTKDHEKSNRSIIHSGLTKNNGTIDIRDGSLTLDGDYEGGRNARIYTSGVLGGDETDLPNLQITGKVTGNTTLVTIDNMGGQGAATNEGITVVHAASVDGQGFAKDGRIVAGAYEYDLVRMDAADYTEWRLTSEATPVPPGPTPPVPPKPVHKMRPEAGTYAENLRQANTLFITDSEQRRAVGKYTDPTTGRTETSSLWLSQTGGHSTRHDASGQLKSDYNRYTVQLGGTLLSLPAGDDGRLEAGVQAGYGHARGNTRSGLTGNRARGTVSGYSTGLYGTWRQHRDGQSGAYISTTLQYSWLNNQVKGDDLAAEKYDARGTTLSLEGGYDYAIWQSGVQNGDSLFIRPHAQVTRMGVKADEHREANGTRVSQQGDGNVFSRTGVRVWLDKAVSKEQRVQPFVETNWLHNTRDFCSSMDGVRDCLAGNRNQAEVLAGVRGDVSPDVAVTAQAGGRFGSQAGRDLAGTLNVSVKF